MLSSRTILLSLGTTAALWAHAAHSQAEPPAPFDLMALISQGPALDAEQAAERAVRAAPSMEKAEALARAAEAAVDRTHEQLYPRLDLLARYVHAGGYPVGRISLGGSAEQQAAARALADQVADPASRALWISTLEQTGGGKRIAFPNDQVALSARLSWPVSDVIFAVRPALESARAVHRVRLAQRLARESRVRLSAREAFYQLARARGSLAVAQRAHQQALSEHEQIAGAVRAGIRPPAEASSAEARAAAARRAVSSAETAVDVTSAALRSLLQDGAGAPYGIHESLFADVADADLPPAEQLVAHANGKRQDVKALREGILAQNEGVRAQQASGYPHLSVYVGGDYARPNRYVIPPNFKMQPSWEVGAQLSYSPNDSVTARRRVAEGRAEADAISADLEELTRSLYVEVEQSRATLSRARESIAAARAAERAAQDAYDRRTSELGAGEVTIADLFSAESQLNVARLHVLDAVIDERVARARLAYALGD